MFGSFQVLDFRLGDSLSGGEPVSPGPGQSHFSNFWTSELNNMMSIQAFQSDDFCQGGRDELVVSICITFCNQAGLCQLIYF